MDKESLKIKQGLLFTCVREREVEDHKMDGD